MTNPAVEVRTEVLQMPMMTRLAPVTAINAESRSVNLVWTTGAAVQRYDWYNDRHYMEELSLDPAHVRMGRLESGRAPLLNTHGRYDLSDVMGVIRSASLGPSEGIATAEFSKREDVEPYYQDVIDKIIGNISVGYSVFEYDRIPPLQPGGVWRYLAVDWEPSELSLVPIGADADCGVRSAESGKPPVAPTGRMHECRFNEIITEVSQPPAAAGTTTRKASTMTDKTTPAAVTTANNPAADNGDHARALDAARADGARIEGERIAGIREAVQLGGLDASFADQLIGQRDLSVADAGMAVLREKAKRDAATPTRTAAHIITVSDETDMRRAAMGDAIVLRANPNAYRNSTARVEAARQYRGMTLMDMARESIETAGGNTRGMSRREIAVAALRLSPDLQTRAGMQSTSDFPEILGNTVGRTIREAYLLQPRTFTGWTRESTAPDFRQIARVQLSESSAFKKINEGGEYKAIAFGESAEKYALGKFGGIVSLNWETIINDDLAAFDRVPLALAAEAAALEGDIVYGILTDNGAMSDSIALFHADHKNIITAGAIDDAKLGLGRAAMRKQVGIKGRVLNLAPSFLIVGPDNESLANKYTSASFVAAKASDINPNFNTSLEVIVDSRIIGNAWYLSAAPAMVDTIEYSYLEGEQGLYTETRNGFEVDGVQIKARHVFAAKAIDWRGIQKNAGQ